MDVRRMLAALALATAPLAAQGGGFNASDLVVYSPAIEGISGKDGAVVLVDVAAGQATMLSNTDTTLQAPGAAAFDPYRQRVLFVGGFGAATIHLWASDASGQLDDLGFPGQAFQSLAPAGDGRVYLRDPTGLAPLKYIDAANALHTVMDATGTVPFVLEGNPSADFNRMIYDAPTNSLFLASDLLTCIGGGAGQANIRKLPLSADGSRVVGPIGCVQFDVSPSGERPVGWGHGPSGQLVLVIDTNSSAIEPHIILVDPSTLATTVFASPNSGSIGGGAWASTLNAAVTLDTFADNLHAYTQGSSGPGSTIPIAGTPVSAAGSSGEVATLLAVEASTCGGAWGAYGVGLAGSGGFVPALSGVGCPKIGGVFSLKVQQGLGGATGQLFVGLAQASVPFKGGTFLVGSLAVQFGIGLTGASGVPGAGALTLPAALPPDPGLVGAKVYLQAGLKDAGAGKGASLTNGLRLEIG